MRPNEVLDGLGDFRSRVSTVPQFAYYVSSCLLTKPRVNPYDVEQVQDFLLRMTEGAQCFQVTSNMCSLVQVAAECFSEDDTFRFDHAPAPRGVVQFESPIQMLDVRGQTLNASWVFWSLLGREPVVLTFADKAHKDEATDEFLKVLHEYPNTAPAIGRWFWSGIEAPKDGQRLSLVSEESRRAFVEEFPLDAFEKASQSNQLVDLQQMAAKKARMEQDTQATRILKALWILMSQRAGVVETRLPDRAGFKRARRLKIHPEVTVVELRRPHARSDEDVIQGEGRNWSFRWMVSGHYAWRKCSEHHPLAEEYEKGWRCRIYIHPYAKNADHSELPWKMSEKVYRLSR